MKIGRVEVYDPPSVYVLPSHYNDGKCRGLNRLVAWKNGRERCERNATETVERIPFCWQHAQMARGKK